MTTVEMLAQALREIATSDHDGNPPLARIMASRASQALRAYDDIVKYGSEKCVECGNRTTYQGWANYETWEVALELSNNEGDYDNCTEIVTNAGNVYDGATALKEYYESLIDDTLSSWTMEDHRSKKRHMELSDIPFSSLYTASLSAVDWQEVARSFKSDEWGDSDTAPEETEKTEETDDWQYCMASGCFEHVTPQTGVMDHNGDWYCTEHADERDIADQYNHEA